MYQARLVLLFSVLNITLALASDLSGYRIHVTAVPAGPRRARVTVTTNIPDRFTLNAHLERHGMKPDDLFIGTGDTVVVLHGGKAQFILDGSGMEHFPADRYDAVVNLYLGSEHNAPIAQKLNITGMVSASTTLTMFGSGPSAHVITDIQKEQVWLENTVNTDNDVPWNPAEYTRHLGPFTELPIQRTDIDHQIFKLYYFPRVDRTIRVNLVARIVLKEEAGRGHWTGL